MKYTGGFAAVQVAHPLTGALVGEVERGGLLDVPEDVVPHLSAEFKPEPANVNKKKEAAA